MSLGIQFPGIKTDGELIIDGHHRYIASLLANIELEVYPSFKTSATSTYHWNTVLLSEEDWDTPTKIKLLNEKDALFNQIDLKYLELILESA
ncbi:MAG: hypothetical protein K1X56_13750 [Flavobacteriales bacterium]|nr:hypothetical protein [Flavobacteriales bacterium]